VKNGKKWKSVQPGDDEKNFHPAGGPETFVFIGLAWLSHNID